MSEAANHALAQQISGFLGRRAHPESLVAVGRWQCEDGLGPTVEHTGHSQIRTEPAGAAVAGPSERKQSQTRAQCERLPRAALFSFTV